MKLLTILTTFLILSSCGSNTKYRPRTLRVHGSESQRQAPARQPRNSLFAAIAKSSCAREAIITADGIDTLR